MGRRREEHSFLPVYFLQFQIGGKQIPIGDFTLLQKFLHRKLRRRIWHQPRFHFVLNFYDQPVRRRHPLNLRGRFLPSTFYLQLNFMRAFFDLAEDLCGINPENIVK